MTKEIEKTFFDTFGIEPTLKYYCPSCNTELEKWLASEGFYYRCGNHLECDYFLDIQSEDFEECLNCLNFKLTYPQITDTHYLKLICELSKCKAFFNNFYRFQNVDIEQLKEQVLTDCIYQAIYFKHQVQALFEEGK